MFTGPTVLHSLNAQFTRPGGVQVSEKERKVELEETFRDVASVILEKCINPETNRPYTLGLIQRGLKEIHFAADPKRSVKQQV
jgi:ribosome maturation protein SDO1